MSVIRVIKKFRLILSSHQKLRIFELGLLMIFGGFLETLSVSLIVPFMQAVMEPAKIMNNQYVMMICDFCNIHSARSFLVFVAAVLAAIYIIKNVFLLFEYSIQYRFVYNNMFAMQKQILDNFIHRPYEYFLSANTGELIQIITNDTANTFALLIQLLNLFTEIVVSAALIIVTFAMAPEITVCIAIILVVLMLIINYAFKPILRRAGIRNQDSCAEMNKWLLQSIQGIKELKVQRKEAYFQDNYDRAGQIYVETVRQNNVYCWIPRYLIEGISMSAFFFIVAFMISQGKNLEEIVPMLSAVAMAAMRLLPSVNRISVSLSGISYNEPMLDKLIENLKMIEESNTVSLAAIDKHAFDNQWDFRKFPVLSKSIQVDHITYHYPNTEKNVLKDASLTILPGESIGIVGASGAGKTTLVDIMLGLLKPVEGEIKVDDVNIGTNPQGWLEQIGYIPQMIFMLDGSIRDNVAFGVERKDIDDTEVWRALQEASLDTFVKSLPEGLDTQLGERGIRISGGQRQRIGIARALYTNPSALFFDEATSALDTETESAIMESINHLHGMKTMVIIAHRLTTIEGCDHVYRVQDGKILKER